jgi:hypothetical protein
METLIIKPKDKAELKFILELTKRMGIQSATIESDPDERLFQSMEKNKNTSEISREKVIDTLHRILNDES